MKQLNQRQEQILLSLKKLDFLNRDQLQKLHRLGSVRNTNRVLSELSPFLSKYREEYSTIYYLNRAGREYVGSEKVRKKGNKVNHVIARNSFYMFAGCPAEWKNEVKVKDNEGQVICDSWFKAQNRFHFLEVDLQQSLSENKVKAQSYLGLYHRKAIEKQLGYFPPLIWLTHSTLRKKRLEEACQGLPYVKVYTLEDIQ